MAGGERERERVLPGTGKHAGLNERIVTRENQKLAGHIGRETCCNRQLFPFWQFCPFPAVRTQ